LGSGLADIFLSYNRDDLLTARRFAVAFEREGFSVWWDQTINPGEVYDRVTEKALQDAKAVVVLWSKRSVESHWVRAEATQAHSNGTLVPVMIENCKRPIMFELTQTAELSHWKGNADDPAWQAYVAGLRRFIQKEASAAIPMPVASAGHKRVSPYAMAVAIALFLVAGAMLWAVIHHKPATGPAAVAATPAATEVTLAVLPFADMSPAHDQEYFSDGLTEEVLNQLAQIRGLSVTARTSSFSFKGKNEDMRIIGQKLGVANLLEGSVRKDGKQLRITTQLINSSTGAHLWSRTYDRELSKVFDLQDEIAKDVAQALSIRLDVGNVSRAMGGTTNIEAYDKFLQARALSNQDAQRDQLIQGVRLLREAVKLDPSFVMAWGALADELNVLTLWEPESDAALRKEMAEAQAQVLKLAPDGLVAQTVRWQKLMVQRKWAEAAAATEIIARDPEGEEVQVAFLISVGRFSEALTHMEHMRRRDPLSLFASTNMQLALSAVGRDAETEAEYNRSRDLAGDHSRSEFFEMWRQMVRKNPDRVAIRQKFGTTLASENLPVKIDASFASKFDDESAACAVIREAFEDPVNQEALRMSVISILAGMFGDRDIVLSALRRSLVNFDGFMADVNIWLPYDPGMRTDPRFKVLLRDLGLADYFRTSGNWGDFCKPVGTDDFECH
jgi:TolB-like protein